MINNENDLNKNKIEKKIQKIQTYINNNFPESEEKVLNNRSLNLKKNNNIVNSINSSNNVIISLNLKQSQNFQGRFFY